MRPLVFSFVSLMVAVLALACGNGGLYGGNPTATRRPSTSPAPVTRTAAAAASETPPPPAQPSPTSPAPAATSAAPPPPTSTPMAAPTEAPAPTAPPAGPITLTVTARNIRFEQTELTVDAGAEVTLTFDNQDRVSHNLDIEGVARTDIFAGPGQRTVTFTAPAPGSYAYRCDVHPAAMRGTLIVR